VPPEKEWDCNLSRHIAIEMPLSAGACAFETHVMFFQALTRNANQLMPLN